MALYDLENLLQYRVFGVVSANSWTPYMGFEWNLIHLIIKMWRFAYRFLFLLIGKFFIMLWPFLTLKIKFNIGYMVCEHGYFNILHGIEIKHDTFNYHDVKIHIPLFMTFFCKS